MKLTILVQSSNDARYGPCADVVLRTWAATRIDNVETYLYFGRRDDLPLPPKGYAYVDGQIMVCDSDDIHYTVNNKLVEVRTMKFVRALDWVLTNTDSDFIYRCNCTCYVDQQGLYDYVLQQPAENLYSGPICLHNDEIYLASGCDLLLSRDVAQYLVDHHEELDPDLIDDIAFGKLLVYDRDPRLGIKNRQMTIYRKTEREALKKLPGVFHYKFGTGSMDNMEHMHNTQFKPVD